MYFFRYVFLPTLLFAIQMYNGDWGKAPKSWGVFENFMSKVTLQYWGSRSTAGCITCSLNNFIGGAAAPSAPCFRVYGVFSLQSVKAKNRYSNPLNVT